MQRWFLSYNSRDFTLVDGLQNALKRKDPDAQIFFAPKSLRAGGYWLPSLAEGIAGATAFALIIGENGLGPWQVMEYYEALDRRVKSPDFPVVLVLLEGQPAPGLAFLRQLHWIMTQDPGSDQTAARLVDAGAGGGSRPGELWRYTSPYRGLAAMTEADSDFFFGRQQETGEVLAALANTTDRLPVLLGNSGVGKSSLAQAGVLAALKRQAWPDDSSSGAAWPQAFHDSRRWCFLTFKPGADPLKALVEPFLDTWQFAATDPERVTRQNGWIEILREKKATLHDLLDATERRHQELDQTKPPAFFVYVDQGEELYVRSEESQRLRFSTLLAEGLSDPRLRALMSLRADFLGALQNDPPLYSVHEKIDVPPLREAELHEAVSRPAALLSARFETEGLAADIARRTAEESAKDAGALPLLSYLLDDMWTAMIKRGDGVLRLPAQAMELGGVLADRANAFLARYPGAEETLRRVLTLKLATVREDGEPTRRLARRSEFTDEEWRLVSELADHPHRLLVTATPEAGETYAEVAHEAIFRRWDKLREWIAAEREFLVWKSKLEGARRSWEQSPENSRNDALLMGLALAQAQSWHAKRAEDLPATDRDFIDRSMRREALERQQKEALRRRVFGTAIAALVIVTALAAFSFFQWRDAVSQKIEAVKQQQVAQQERDRAQRAVETFLYRLFSESMGGDRAIADLDDAIKLNPADTTNYFLRAILYVTRKDTDHAIADLSRVIEIDPTAVGAYLTRASEYASRNDYDHEIADLDQVIKLDPGLTAGYLSRAAAYEGKKDFDRAIADYNQVLKSDPKSSLAYNGRGYDYYNKNDYDHAIADYSQAIQINPRFALAFNNRGNAYYDKKRYDQALADYSQAIALDPNNDNSYYWYNNRGNVYYNTRDYDRAVADYGEAIRHNPQYGQAYANRAYVFLFFKSDNDRAIADYSQAIALDPNNASNYFWYNYRGQAHSNNEDYKAAIADYSDAIRLNAKFALARVNRSDAYAEVHDFDHAIDDASEALKIDPNNAQAFNARCWARTAANRDLPDALKDCDQALHITPNYSTAFENRAFTYLRLGQFDKAIADFDSTLKIDPQNADVLYGRGLAKGKNGDQAGSAADIAAAKAMNGDAVSELVGLGFK
ncbi:MAG: tetratricopeptide repeat protein [Xanthobacteraceae bacterium]